MQQVDSHASGDRRMNYERLKEAEAIFLARFPGGFGDPGLERVRKSHNVAKLSEFTRANLTAITISQPQKFADVLQKIVGRASMVSRFEKPPFREMLGSLTSKDKRRLADAFRKRLVGRKKREGFEEIVDFLAHYRLARWSLVSAVPFYFAPTKEVFVKPTTAKKIIAGLEIEELDYRPRPDWAFYDGYRKLILDIRQKIDPSLAPHNAAVAGFLMTTL